MENREKAELIKQELLKLIVTCSEKKGWNKSEFAQKVWPDRPASAISKWNAIRNKVSKTGKNQALEFTDVIVMATILDEDFISLISVAIANTDKQAKARKLHD